MSHPAIDRANAIGARAAEYGWTGSFSSEIVDTQRITILALIRNDESLGIEWVGKKFSQAKYYLFDKLETVSDLSRVKSIILGWPDIADLFRWFPNMNRPLLTNTYRKLPFSFDDDNEEIIEKLIGTKIFWYESISGKIRADVVLIPKGAKAKVFRIQDVGHRKLFHFVGAQAGTRSVLLDTILKVSQ